MKYEEDDALEKISVGLVKGLEDLEISGRVETIRTTALLRSGPGDLMGLAVTQTPVENHQLLLVWKTLKEVK